MVGERGLMNVTWLGQGGVLFDTGKTKIMIDPYFSDSVERIDAKCKRRFPVPSWASSINPDFIICTHNHLDHLDEETLSYFINENTSLTILGPSGSWEKLRKFGGSNNYVLFNKGTEWSEKDIKLKAIMAIHSDSHAIGVLVDDGDKKYYVTGDTLYGEEVLDQLSGEKIEALFIPINGKGNNMNAIDASRFASRVNANHTIPIHYSLFDDMTGNELECDGRIIMKPFETITL